MAKQNKETIKHEKKSWIESRFKNIYGKEPERA